MRKELTRTKQALDKETVRKIIETTAYGVLSLNGDDGYLYTVPLSYVYTDGVVYFHGSPRGYKYECFQRTNIPDNEDEIQHSLNYVFMTKLVPEWITGKQAALEVREAATTL